jgi:flagellar FliL protein
MADEEVKEEGKKKGNPMMIVLIILIIVLLAAVGGGGYLLYTKGVFSDAPKDVTPKSETVTQTDEKEDVGEIFKAKIEGLVLNITDAKGRAKLMKLSFTLKTTEPTIEIVLENNKAEIIDSVIRQVGSRTSEELLTVGGKDMLKEEMIDEINNILNDSIKEGDEERKRNCLLDIFFTSFVIK